MGEPVVLPATDEQSDAPVYPVHVLARWAALASERAYLGVVPQAIVHAG